MMRTYFKSTAFLLGASASAKLSAYSVSSCAAAGSKEDMTLMAFSPKVFYTNASKHILIYMHIHMYIDTSIIIYIRIHE
jgi:hypothetical protein